MLNINASKILSTKNPFTKNPVNIITTALIINKNNPSVMNVIGNVKNIKIGFTRVFKNASTIATIIAVV